MLKTSLVFGFMLMMLFVLSSNLIAAGTQPNGSGTELEPYIVGLPDHLLWISTNSSSWSKYFEQNTNINTSGLTWTPIGNWGTNFTGTYDGKDYTIDGLNYYSGDTGKGVFGAAVGAVIKNLGITNVDMTGYTQVGGLVGYTDGSTEITNCYTTGSVHANNDTGGGLVGENRNSTITDCYSSAIVSGSWYTPSLGGLVGKNNVGTIITCYSTGNVTGNYWIGGLVGYHLASSHISDCYSTGSVIMSNNSGGGLVGYTENSTISNSYSTGSSNDDGLVGGNNNTTVSNCFWNTQTSGQSSSQGGTGKTTAEMKDVRTFTDVAWSVGLSSAWDFYSNPYDDVGNNDYWDIDVSTTRNNGYPFLSWEYSTHSLPITLSTFTAQLIENTPTLYWETQSETDNMGWFVYRNIEEDFTTSEKISEFIDGHGTTTQQQSYIYEDRIQNPEVGDTYYYWLESIDFSGMVNHYDKVAILTIPDQQDPGTGIIPEPELYGLLQNNPNPFIESTKISFNLPETEKVELNIYNLKGQLVRSLYSGVASSQTLEWNGKNEIGKELQAGMYFYKLMVNGKTAETKKLILMR